MAIERSERKAAWLASWQVDEIVIVAVIFVLAIIDATRKLSNVSRQKAYHNEETLVQVLAKPKTNSKMYFCSGFEHKEEANKIVAITLIENK